MTVEPLDLDALARDAEALVHRVLGREPIETLVRAMRDYDVPPVFLWRGDYPDLAAVAVSVTDALRPSLESLTDDEAAVVQAMRRTLVFDRDPARGLLELATAPQYGAIPPSLLHPPEMDSRVLTTLPTIANRIDKRGLLDLLPEWDARPDVLFVGDSAVQYHQFLRRGFQARINDGLISRLLLLQRQGLTMRIAIDEHRLHPRAAHIRIEERDFWSGPPFTEARLDDPAQRQVEVRQHGWPDGAVLLPWEKQGHLSIRTSLSKGLRTVEIEEVPSPSLMSESEFQLVRYLHAERDIRRHVFTHFDGAVRFYDRAAYEARRSVRWPTRDEETPLGRRKVFRIDGDVDAQTWSDVVAQWFRDNRLVLEALTNLGVQVPGVT